MLAYVFVCFTYLRDIFMYIQFLLFFFVVIYYFSESQDKYENLREEKQKPLLPGYQNSTCLWVGGEGEGNYTIPIICFLDLFEFAFCSLEFSTN